MSNGRPTGYVVHYSILSNSPHLSQIIGRQLVRNMGLAFAVIALVSLLLIADPIVRLEIDI